MNNKTLFLLLILILASSVVITGCSGPQSVNEPNPTGENSNPTDTGNSGSTSNDAPMPPALPTE
jgi:uncharacterized lipoprotein YajG